MIKPMRKNVLVDCGKVINQLGAELIITPDQYKKIDNISTILAIGPQCRIIDSKHIGKKCIVDVVRDDERRYSPATSEKYGLKPHWHMLVPERFISVVLDK